MKTLDFTFYGVMFFLGLGIALLSLTMGYGEKAQPGSGFLPFWCGVFIAGLAGGLAFQQWRERGRIRVESREGSAGIDPLSPLTILGGMFVYGLVFETLGFILCNLFFLVLILRVVWKKGWGFILPASLLIVLAFYLVMQLMEVRLPSGILGGVL